MNFAIGVAFSLALVGKCIRRFVEGWQPVRNYVGFFRQINIQIHFEIDGLGESLCLFRIKE